jgi:CheY-like chemotaxis protein
MAVTAMVIDDSAAARQIISYHLSQIGCKIIGEAANAADAVKLCGQLKPNIITLDLMMPTKDNIDSVAAVRAIKKEVPDTAIIVVSVVPFEKTKQNLKDEGVMDYVIKPFNAYTLANIRLKLERAFPELAVMR